MCEVSASWPPSTPPSLTGSSHGQRHPCTGKRPSPPTPSQFSSPMSCAPPAVVLLLVNPASAPMQHVLQYCHAAEPAAKHDICDQARACRPVTASYGVAVWPRSSWMMWSWAAKPSGRQWWSSCRTALLLSMRSQNDSLRWGSTQLQPSCACWLYTVWFTLHTNMLVQ